MRYLQAGFPPLFNRDFFQSHWQLTQRCNFHCSYCVNQEQRKDGIHMSADIMRLALQRIADLSRQEYRFSLSGGEVTLYPHLENMLAIIGALFPSGTVVNMLSNGSASAHRMRMLLSIDQTLQCRFIITIHLGQTNVPQLIEKLLEFPSDERKKCFHLKIVAPPHDARIQDIRKQLEETGIQNYSIHAVVDFESGKIIDGYTEQDFMDFAPRNGKKEYFRYRHIADGHEDTEVTFLEGLRRDMFHYSGMYCSAGYQSIYLDEYGHVSKGQFCGRMPYTIQERNPFTDPNFFAPMQCIESHCTCTPFTSLPKWSDAAHTPAWLKREGDRV